MEASFSQEQQARIAAETEANQLREQLQDSQANTTASDVLEAAAKAEAEATEEIARLREELSAKDKHIASLEKQLQDQAASLLRLEDQSQRV